MKSTFRVLVLFVVLFSSVSVWANKPTPVLQCAKTLGFTSIDGNYVAYAKPKEEEGPGFLLVLNEHEPKVVPMTQEGGSLKAQFVPSKKRTAYRYVRAGSKENVKEFLTRISPEDATKAFLRVAQRTHTTVVAEMESIHKATIKEAVRYLGLAAQSGLKQFPEKQYKSIPAVRNRLKQLRVCKSLHNGYLTGAIISREEVLRDQLRNLTGEPAYQKTNYEKGTNRGHR